MKQHFIQQVIRFVPIWLFLGISVVHAEVPPVQGICHTQGSSFTADGDNTISISSIDLLSFYRTSQNSGQASGFGNWQEHHLVSPMARNSSPRQWSCPVDFKRLLWQQLFPFQCFW